MLSISEIDKVYVIQILVCEANPAELGCWHQKEVLKKSRLIKENEYEISNVQQSRI
jgi:hypothetical protein